MRKIVITCVMVAMTAFCANAQVFIGGGLGLNVNGGSYTDGSTTTSYPTAFTIEFAPKVGFYLNDAFAIGAGFGIANGSFKIIDADPEISGSLTEWSFRGFARMRLAETGDLGLHVEGSVGIGGENWKITQGSTTNTGDPTTTIFLGVLPVITYEVTRGLSLEATCDFLQLGFVSRTTKNSDDSNQKRTNYSFDLGVNSDNYWTYVDQYGYSVSADLVSSAPLIKIGLILKF